MMRACLKGMDSLDRVFQSTQIIQRVDTEDARAGRSLNSSNLASPFIELENQEAETRFTSSRLSQPAFTTSIVGRDTRLADLRSSFRDAHTFYIDPNELA